MLVNMPWQWLQMPSISIGILRACVSNTIPDIEVEDYYANLKWSDYLLEQSHGEFTPTQYEEIADIGMFHGIGDWVFAPTVYDDDSWRDEEFSSYMRDTGVAALSDIAHVARHYVRPFIAEVVTDILAWRPTVVGFTTSFSQTMPALAAARHLKAAAPDVITVLGGSNCEDTMGAALHRNFPFIDFVIRGEGERSFPQLLAGLCKPTTEEAELAKVAGLCWWSGAGDVRASHANSASHSFVPVREIPALITPHGPMLLTAA
jgi:magnesium-protoporphyrin IX monomethyl ester (oxidative) cyclase